MQCLKYLVGYPEPLQATVREMIADDRLERLLRGKYAAVHDVRTDRVLYAYVMELKNEHLRNAPQLSKVVFDSKLKVIQHA